MAQSAQNMLQRLVTMSDATAGANTSNTDLKQLIVNYVGVGKTTSQLAQTIYDSTYVNKTLTDEQKRVQALDVAAKKNIYKVRQLTLTESYRAKYYRFVTNVMIFTCFVTMLCLIMLAMMRSRPNSWISLTGPWIIGAVIIFYTMCMVVVFNNVKTRTPGDWDQYYFRPSSELLSASGIK